MILLQWGNFGGDVYATHISENSYLYTGFFASQYQEQYPGLTPTPARMILNNAADGGAPLDFEVCGFSKEQQIAMVEDYNSCYTGYINGPVSRTEYSQYVNSINESIMSKDSSKNIYNIDFSNLQEAIEDNALLLNEGESV